DAFGNALNDSSFLQQIDPRLAAPFLVGFSEAMSVVFLVASVVMVIAFVASWFLPHVELRSGSSYDQRNAENAEVALAAAQDNGAAAQSVEPVAAGAVVGGHHEGVGGNGSGPNGSGPLGKHEGPRSEPELAVVSASPDGEASSAKPAGRYIGRHRG
ncbi:MAG: hypothetical protein WCG47_31580, partial [Dermatophilaceae bacterium]